MSFRKDINGLRAIAVLAVVLYHFGVKGFNGGFIGVDVFFVISGFLMTGIIVTKVKENNFSLIGFYFERARRIIPALAFLCFALAISGWFFLIPTDYEILGKHIVNSILFLSNITYFNEVNYFDAISKEKWLLHTWSLSVEWQFYILYPIIILLIAKLIDVSKIKIILFAFAVASFIASVYISYNTPSASFYLLHARAWEMLSGGMVFLFPINISGKGRKILNIVGIGIILFSILKFSHSDVWPGWLAILPVLGAVFVIYSKDSESILTDNNVSQFIGKTSYSTYLWHWPVVVYLNYMNLDSNLWIFIGVVISISLGVFSYYLIENTSMRWMKWININKGVKNEVFIIISIILISFFPGYHIQNNSGFQSRYPFSMITNDELMAERSRYWLAGDNLKPVPINGTKKVIIVGNSHGIDLTYSLMESGFKGDITYLRTTNLCGNFGETPIGKENYDTCKKIKESVLSYSDWVSTDVVFVHDNWPVDNVNDLLYILSEFRKKTNAPIYVFGPKMVFDRSPSIITKEAMNSKKSTVGLINNYAKEHNSKERVDLNEKLKKLFDSKILSNQSIYYIDSISVQCGNDLGCDIISPESKKFLYFDYNHFTIYGAKDFGLKLKKSYPELYL